MLIISRKKKKKTTTQLKSERKKRHKGGIWTLEGEKRQEQEIQNATARSVVCLLCEWPEPCPDCGKGIIQVLNSRQFLQWLFWVPAVPQPLGGGHPPSAPVVTLVLPRRSAGSWQGRREGGQPKPSTPLRLSSPSSPLSPSLIHPPFLPVTTTCKIKANLSIFIITIIIIILEGFFFLGIPGMEGVKVIISSMSTASPHPAELHQSSRGSGSGDFTSQPRAVPDCWSLLICVFSLEACWFNHFKDAHFFQARDFMTLRIRSCYPNKPWSSIYSDFMVSFTNKLFKTYVNCVYCIL